MAGDETKGMGRGGVFIALGTNLAHGALEGPRLLQASVAEMSRAGIGIVRASSVWESAPWPPSDQANFFNAALEVEPGPADCHALFERTCAIERAFGRVRGERWAARTLDIDIIDFLSRIGTFGALTLPHPRAGERAFVLAPLAELGWRHPVSGYSAADLLSRLPGGQSVTLRGALMTPSRDDLA